jgi:hypothetical protein
LAKSQILAFFLHSKSRRDIAPEPANMKYAGKGAEMAAVSMAEAFF